MIDVEKMTKDHNSLVLNVCFSYDSTYEIKQAIDKVVANHRG